MPIHCSPLSVLIPFYFFFLHQFIVTVAVNYPSSYSLVDNLAINCGSSGTSTTPEGQEWVGDIGLKFAQLHQQKSKTVTLKSFPQLSDKTDPVPYRTARVSRSRFSYTFEVNPGQKIIRLHFYPASYRGFERSKAFFTVKVGPHTLLSNFSASLTADSLGLKSLVKEFCLNVGKYQALNITFFPSPGSSSYAGYAFINGIEIVSMPTGLYYSQSSEPGSPVVGQNYRIHIENSTALELVQRLNIGGSSISSAQDSGMLREWSEDSNYLIESRVVSISTTIPIKYLSIPTYIAPQKLYQTAWSIGLSKRSNQMNGFTWKLPVDLGFRYLIRLHFCELEYGIKERGQREFCILINEQIAEAYADLIGWGGGNGVAVYRDYVVVMEGDRMEGKRDLLIALRPHCHDQKTKNASNPILNGLEVLKLSNPDNNLAGPNPASLVAARTSKAPKPRKLASVVDGVNAMVNGVIIVITLVNIIVDRLCVWTENSDKKNNAKLFLKEMCRCFSLTDMQLATNNFDDERIIGCGGFGKVYKGIINKGATTVAIKRLNSKSKQGAHEFWTEIEMLSELRHTHLVTLIGYCDDFQEMILVYEYMAHGTLADHVHKIKRNTNGISRLTWEQRLNICVGAARGLNYLHNGSSQTIIHRDVKSTNILLDENWVAKISDFGLSKMGFTSQSSSHVSTNVKGTFGYLDPEYFSTRRLTRKSDVYAFGVVLFEVLSGRPAVDTRLKEEQHSLALWAQHCIREGMLHQIIDPHLTTQISPSCLKVFAEVAKKCLHNHSKDRPTMDDIVGSLELALAAQKSLGSCTDDAAIGVGGAENQQNDEAPQSGISDLQHEESPSFEQGLISVSSKRTKLTITKVFQSMAVRAKGKDLQRKKKDYSSDGVSPRWWQWNPFRQSTKKLKEESLPAPAEDLCRYFSLAEIQAATNNFDHNNIIGGSTHSQSLYKGYIKDGPQVVSIKRYGLRTHGVRRVKFDMEILAELRHVNLLSPIGYCNNNEEKIAVYNYMGNGSLHDHLVGMHDDPLPWKRRLEICIGVSRGLQYLHSGTRYRIIHRDIRPANILLDNDWVPKVSGFELFRALEPSDYTTWRSCGTYDYMAPEYTLYGHVTEKTDVYALGMVLLGVLSGLKVSTIPVLHGWSLVNQFKICMDRKCIDSIIDPYLMGKITPDCLREFVKITSSCLHDQAIERLPMGDVEGRLQLALQLLGTSGEHIQHFGGSEADATEMSFKAAVTQAYNEALFDDSGFNFATASPQSEMICGKRCPSEMSFASLDDSDCDPSNLAR